MKTSEVLNQAADLIEERGWTTGDGWVNSGGSVINADGPICLEGGIQAATGIRYIAELSDCPAYRAVMNYLGPTHKYASDWNDGTAESAEQVIEVLRTCALIEAVRETEVRILGDHPAPSDDAQPVAFGAAS